MRAAITWGVVVGVVQAATPLAFWWLDPATVYALGLAVIASVYIGFAVADGRVRIIVVECAVAMAFVVVAAVGITGSAWMLAAGLAAPRVQGRMAGTPSVRFRDPVVAAILRRRRLGRRRDYRDRDRRRDPLPSLAGRTQALKAIVQTRYGASDVLELREIDPPAVGNDQMLVRVRAASVHADVWHVMRSMPYALRIMGAGLRAPKDLVPGTDLAGVVESVGRNVTRFRLGDEVFGQSLVANRWRHGGAFAEYAAVLEARFGRVFGPMDGAQAIPAGRRRLRRTRRNA